jgi:hypothetical protein
MLASLAVVAALVLLASSGWQAQAAPGDSCGIGDVTTYGATGGDTTDDTAAIQAAMVGAGQNPLCFPAGEFRFDQTLTHVPGYKGAHRGGTVLRYTGSGIALGSPTPGTRTYHWLLEDLRVVDGGTGTVGLDMPCVSQAHVRNVQISDFTTGLRISCATDGGSLYNAFYDLTVSGATTGIKITGLSSNEHKFHACRVNVSDHAVLIDGGNHNVFDGCAFESATNGGGGVHIVNTDSDRNQIVNSRFENVPGYSVQVDSGTRGTVLAFNDRVAATAPAYDVDGTDTTVIDNGPGGPALELTDSDTAGDPTTFKMNVTRWSGVPLQVMRTSDSTQLLRLSGDGALQLRVDTALPLPSASVSGVGALLVYDPSSAGPRLIFSDGSIWRYVADNSPV